MKRGAERVKVVQYGWNICGTNEGGVAAEKRQKPIIKGLMLPVKEFIQQAAAWKVRFRKASLAALRRIGLVGTGLEAWRLGDTFL